jgi:protein-disulfide isomerase
MTIDPEQEMREEVERNKVILSSEHSPIRGNKNVVVTIVEVSDFECPYCKQFAEWLSAVPEELQSQARIVYKNFPLEIHPWAHEAAVLASCADLQSEDAFWRLHDFMFKNQRVLSSSTLHDRVAKFVQTILEFSAKNLFASSGHGRAEAAIYHDKLLVDQLQIDSAPTIFLNVLRIDSLNSLADLKGKLLQALEAALSRRPTIIQDKIN